TVRLTPHANPALVGGVASHCLVPMARIERATSPLPRECSTTELHRLKLLLLCGTRRNSIFATRPDDSGAGEGNRTLVVSLEGFCSTIELHPLGLASSEPSFPTDTHTSWWRGKDSNLRRQSRQIYSLIP